MYRKRRGLRSRAKFKRRKLRKAKILRLKGGFRM